MTDLAEYVRELRRHGRRRLAMLKPAASMNGLTI
jgi:hypothetical protein